MQKLDSASKPDQKPPRARGRPRAFDRTEALDRATRLFWENGYEATSIADLTGAMGVGAPSLYAAFGSKEALYEEALRHYADTNQHFVWDGYFAAPTARAAVRALLMDSAAALTGCVADMPRGCMVALSNVGGDGHDDLRELVRGARAITLDRLKDRFARAVAAGEIPASADLHALARFVQTIQTGMSILARDGAGREELKAVAALAIAGWDARLAGDGAQD
ncbi:TetR/AcrR family transcriptional regulator [Sphingopyxis sp.]|jgi:AcrR family transcriptional regulator|uniref:TetR/AcrR family transcriptional regulator n=1 Tax=Sphingopyxis sp. TaxID=1908224 RepID=UPI002DE4F2E7|nr:TetR/AcrR family transcriptional regulator [Sphingopyxis sp.]